MAEANKTPLEKFSNVTVAFAKIAEPAKKYESEDTEYSIDVVVTKEQAKVWNKRFPKQKAKEVEMAEFEERYKMEAPYDADEIYVVKLKKGASKNGEIFDLKFRPKVFLDTEDERVEITTSRLISNGTIADISYRVIENKFGTFPQLNNIRILEKNFKEYVPSASNNGSEFDDEDEPKKIIRKEPDNEAATKARANKESSKKAVTKKQEEPEDEFDDDVPY